MVTTKKTQFDTVEIRYYPFVLSDNPGTTYGPPIELGWEYYTNQNDGSGHKNTLKLSSYEKERKNKRRNSLYLSEVTRESMLREADYSEGDLQRAIRRKEKIRRHRKLNNILMNPVTKLLWNIQCERRLRKLGRALRNLRLLRSDGMFHDHSAIYIGWWIPSIV